MTEGGPQRRKTGPALVQERRHRQLDYCTGKVTGRRYFRRVHSALVNGKPPGSEADPSTGNSPPVGEHLSPARTHAAERASYPPRPSAVADAH